MIIALIPEQESWLKAQVEQGEFSSIEEAISAMIAERMIRDSDDLAWVKPAVDEARAAALRGETLPSEQAQADIFAHLATLRR